LEKAAERELKEELCVSVKPGFFARDVLDYNNRRRFVEIFWCKSDGPFEIHSDLAEVKFFRPEEIWEMLETKEFTPGFRMLWEKHGREFEGFVKRLGKPEFIDALDDSGKPISRVTREELHSRKLNFAGTHVWLFNSDKKILLQLRSPKVSFCPSHWDSGAGGHVLAGESVEGAAVREMVEELGVKPVIKLFARETLDFKDGRKRFANVFVGKCDDQFYLNEELDSVKFFSAGEIDAMIESGEKVTPAFKVLWKKFGNDFRREFLT
jgi:isopentenyldiphosphate isomerase